MRINALQLLNRYVIKWRQSIVIKLPLVLLLLHTYMSDQQTTHSYGCLYTGVEVDGNKFCRQCGRQYDRIQRYSSNITIQGGSRICQRERTMASAQRDPITGICVRSPQLGPGRAPRGSRGEATPKILNLSIKYLWPPLKLKASLSTFIQKRGKSFK